MNAQFGKQNLIDQTTGIQSGLGVVVAEGSRVACCQDCSASERLLPDCRGSVVSLRTLRHSRRDRLHQAVVALWRSDAPRAIPTTDPDSATITALPAVENRLPAPAWAALVLNHALCG
jgi:hypothetical protein